MRKITFISWQPKSRLDISQRIIEPDLRGAGRFKCLQFAKNVSTSQENHPRCCHSIYSLSLSDQLQRLSWWHCRYSMCLGFHDFRLGPTVFCHNDGWNCPGWQLIWIYEYLNFNLQITFLQLAFVSCIICPVEPIGLPAFNPQW